MGGDFFPPELGCRLTSALGVAADDGVALLGVDHVQLLPGCDRQVSAPLAGHRALGGGRGEHTDLLIVLQDRGEPAIALCLCAISARAAGRDGGRGFGMGCEASGRRREKNPCNTPDKDPKLGEKATG